jgi:hypothetical protein
MVGRLCTTGMNVPDGFPVDAYNDISHIIGNKIPTAHISWDYYAGAWNAIGYRYLLMLESSESFSNSISRYGAGPPSEERLKQENSLFTFFSAGLSVIESFSYGLYAITSFINPTVFPIATVADIKNISTENLCNKLLKYYPKDNVSLSMKNIIKDTDYQNFKSVRNVLIHRSAPGRYIHVNEYSGVWKLDGLTLDDKFTPPKCKWVMDTTNVLINDAYDFVKTHIIE